MALNDGTDPTGGSSAPPPPGAPSAQSKYTPIPGHPGMFYDPATGAVYGNSGGSGGYVPGGDYPVPGMTYDPKTGNLTNNGSTYTPSNPTSTQPAGGWTPTTATSTPPPPSGGGGGGAGAGGTGATGPFATPTPYQPLSGTPSSWMGYPNAPQFPNIPAFAAPTMAEAQSDPGYQFASQQGEQALQQTQAAQGLTNTGGSLKDILAWGQNYAAQRYSDVYNRDLTKYNTNVQTQYLDPYAAAYQTWGTNLGVAQRQNEFLTNTAYNAWAANNNNWLNYQQFLWGPTGPINSGA